ncbi:MAG: PD-(D/E)XK nuclease family protein [Kiritimatiellia bacterium]
MSELQNVFSWSHSASKDFETCRRMRYWDKYAKWGGWSRTATQLQKDAYRLGKMDTRFNLQGQAAEQAAMWMLRRAQRGEPPDPDEAWEKVAKPWLRQHWDQSLHQEWKTDPKKCCLHEHYYPQFTQGTDKERIVAVAGTVKTCLKNFAEIFLPRFAGIRPEDEIPVAVIGSGGDPESFTFEGVKIYAIPDYVHVKDGVWHIHDWKSGRARDEHHDQLAIYALWAVEKHGVPPEKIRVLIEYLGSGETVAADMTAERVDVIRQHIRESVLDMAEYLVDADIHKNRPLPREEWELTTDRRTCARCKFFELCAPELAEEIDGSESE